MTEFQDPGVGHDRMPGEIHQNRQRFSLERAREANDVQGSVARLGFAFVCRFGMGTSADETPSFAGWNLEATSTIVDDSISGKPFQILHRVVDPALSEPFPIGRLGTGPWWV